MPKEVKSAEDFKRLLEDAIEVRVVKSGENAKVKVRTGDSLFTHKTTAEEADSLVKGVKAPVVEI